jgi:Uma2 family endonuclease
VAQPPITPGEPLLSVEDWADMPEDEPGELVDGRLVEEEMADLAHETAVAWLIEVLRAWVVALGGHAFGSEVKLAVGPRRGRKPDVTLYLPGCPRLPRFGVVRTPPDVAIEVVSRSKRDERRDRIEKPDDYARFGVHWYWILDPVARTLEIFELGADGRYVRALGADAGRIDEVPGCAGLALDLDALWAEIERLEAPRTAPDDE